MKQRRDGLPPPTEDQTQAVIVDALRAHGLLVWVTTRRPRRCWKCGAWPRSGGGDGVSRGLSDLVCRRPAWPPAILLALEVKRPGPVRYSSPEQRLAVEAGDVVVVQSWEAALAHVARIDALLEETP